MHVVPDGRDLVPSVRRIDTVGEGNVGRGPQVNRGRQLTGEPTGRQSTQRRTRQQRKRRARRRKRRARIVDRQHESAGEMPARPGSVSLPFRRADLVVTVRVDRRPDPVVGRQLRGVDDDQYADTVRGQCQTLVVVDREVAKRVSARLDGPSADERSHHGRDDGEPTGQSHLPFGHDHAPRSNARASGAWSGEK